MARIDNDAERHEATIRMFRNQHEVLDIIIAQFIFSTGKYPSRATVMELMQWSAERLRRIEEGD